MSVNAPSQLFFLISLALAIVSLLGYFGVLGGGGVFGLHSFWVAFAGWAVLAIGCVMKGV